MTLNEIKNEVAALGFESDIALDGAFLCAFNRALATIYTEFPSHGRITLYQRAPTPTEYIERIDHTAGENLTFFANGAFCSFTASGAGSFLISDKNGERAYSFNSHAAFFSESISEGASVTFFGEFSYTVYGFSVFDESFGSYGKENAGFCEYTLSELRDDYLCISEPPTGADGKAIAGAEVCCGVLRIPTSYVGQINITYRKRGVRVSAEDAERELDICRETEHLLPLLTASYVWLDDDSEKAQYYMSLYQNGMAALKVYQTRCLDNNYTDTTGWA